MIVRATELAINRNPSSHCGPSLVDRSVMGVPILLNYPDHKIDGTIPGGPGASLGLASGD